MTSFARRQFFRSSFRKSGLAVTALTLVVGLAVAAPAAGADEVPKAVEESITAVEPAPVDDGLIAEQLPESGPQSGAEPESDVTELPDTSTEAPLIEESEDPPIAFAPTTTAALTQQTCQNQVLALVNAERAKAGLSPLSLHAGLNSLSVMWSDWMATTLQMVHLPNTYSNGWALWGAVGAGGAQAENIAAGYGSPEAVMSGWMNSAGHRQNILNPGLRYMGVGCSYSTGGYGIYWTQQFASSTTQPTTNHQRIPLPTQQLSPKITGSRTAGSTLTFSAGGKLPPNTTLAYQWTANGAGIPGATSASYTVASEQSSKVIGVTVTASNNSTFYSATRIPVAGIGSGWVFTNGAWYYIGNDGQKKTGWLKDGAWYYLQSNGAMATGWVNVSGTWYYLASNGAMQTGWVKLGNAWYYLNASGAMATGWVNVGGTWYYLAPSGAMATGWLKLRNTWYYLASSGAMQTGWIQVGGTWYYLNANGAWVG